MKSKYRAINGKLGRSYVIGCYARCFRGRDDNGCNNWKVLSLRVGDAEVISRNLETCNVIRKIRLSTLVLRHLQPSLKVSRKSLQNQGLLYSFTELCIVEVLQSTAQWSFQENKTNYWPQNIPPKLLQPLSSRPRKRRAWQQITCDLTSFPFIAR